MTTPQMQHKPPIIFPNVVRGTTSPYLWKEMITTTSQWSALHKSYYGPSVLHWKNLKTDVSLRKRIKCFQSTLRHKNLKTQQEVWVIDQACSVKMAGYWPIFFFFCVFMDRDGVEVHKLAKKRTRPISSHLDRTSLVNKGFVIWLLGKFFCGKRRAVPSGQDSSILPVPIANHSAGFDSSCPLTEVAI